ncbi:hypothetical protein ACET3Z_001774 [Daucus carota]
MDEFPYDIICNIFLRVPIKTLLKLRCVSKTWCKIIDDPCFAYMQYRCGGAQQDTLLISPEFGEFTRKTISLYEGCDSEEDRMIQAAKIPMAEFEAKGSVFGSCNGLMYFAEFRGVRIVVSNPLRNQFRTLPPLSIENYWSESERAYGLGFDSSTNKFKMVCTIYGASGCCYTLVHVLGTRSWRRISSVPAPYVTYGKPIFAHGFLHWMAEPFSISEKCEGRIMAFDVSNEAFKDEKLCNSQDEDDRRIESHVGHGHNAGVNLEKGDCTAGQGDARRSQNDLRTERRMVSKNNAVPFVPFNSDGEDVEEADGEHVGNDDAVGHIIENVVPEVPLLIEEARDTPRKRTRERKRFCRWRESSEGLFIVSFSQFADDSDTHIHTYICFYITSGQVTAIAISPLFDTVLTRSSWPGLWIVAELSCFVG